VEPFLNLACAVGGDFLVPLTSKSSGGHNEKNSSIVVDSSDAHIFLAMSPLEFGNVLHISIHFNTAMVVFPFPTPPKKAKNLSQLWRNSTWEGFGTMLLIDPAVCNDKG
jgi:hypothetical protein